MHTVVKISVMENQKSLHIALIGQKSALSNEGGIEVVVRELSTRMAAMGHDVTCYNRRGHHVSGREYDGKWRNLKQYRGVKMKSVFTINLKGLAAVTSSLSASIRAALGKFDVVHYHAEGPCAMLWIPKLFDKKCIATIHGIDHLREKWGNKFAAKYIKFGEKIAVKFADEIIVLSKDDQNYFTETYGRKTILIPNAVNRPQTKGAEEIKDKWNLSKDSYILFLGRIVPEKGLHYLIKAFKNLNTDKKLVIAGGTSDTAAYFSEVEKLSLDCVDNYGNSRIIFTGFVDGNLKDELYSNAYVYVLPSDLEGMPLSLLEAMSYGNCCVVSDIKGCVSTVRDEKTGNDKAVIFKKSSVEDLHKKLQMLCSQKEIVQKYKKEAMMYICQKYTWDDVVKQTLELYWGIK